MSTDGKATNVGPPATTAAGIVLKFASAFAAARAVALAVLVSLPFFAIGVELSKSAHRFDHGFGSSSSLLAWRYGLFAVAIVSVIVNRLIYGRLLKKPGRNDPTTGIRVLFRATVIALVFAEIPAGLGIVLFFLGGWTLDFYALLLVSAVLGFMYFPRRTAWESHLRDETKSCRL